MNAKKDMEVCNNATPGPWDVEPMFDMLGNSTGEYVISHKRNPIIYSFDDINIETYVHIRPEVLALIPGKLYLSNRGSSDFPVELYKMVDGVKFLAIMREMSNYPGWREDGNIKGGDNKNEQT